MILTDDETRLRNPLGYRRRLAPAVVAGLVLLAALAAGCSTRDAALGPSTTSSLAAATTISTSAPATTATAAPLTTASTTAATTTAAPEPPTTQPQTGSTGTTTPDPGLYPVRQGFTAGYIDRSGTMVIPATYDSTWEFSEGLAVVQVGSKYGYVDKTGKIVIPAKWDGAGDFSEGVAPVQVGEKYGFIDPHGSLVLPATYGSASGFSGGLAAVALPDKQGGGWVFIDHSGKVKIKGKFSYLDPFSEGLAAAYTAAPGDQPGTMSEWGFIDTSGKFVIGPKAGTVIMPGSNPGPFSQGLASAGADGKVGFIDKTGRFVIPATYEDAGPFSEGLAPVSQDQKWGYIDTSGRLVIPFQFRLAGSFEWGLAAVSDEHGLMSYIDKTGTIVWHETIVIPLSAEKRKQLDSLDAAGVLRAYLQTADPWVQYYLSAPRRQDEMMSGYPADWVPHPENIAHLAIDGPNDGSLDPGEYSPADWPIQEEFGVQYDLLAAPPDMPEEPGPQQRFAYVGRQGPSSPWRVLDIGTGP